MANLRFVSRVFFVFYFIPVVRNLQKLHRENRAKGLQPDSYNVPRGELVLQLRDSTDSLILEKRQKITISATVSWEKLTSELKVEQDGNLTVFIDNQDTEAVYFDALEINITERIRPLIVQEHHYYPFGMGMKGLEKENDLAYQFNGMIEREKAFGLELYETANRGYDPQIGRFWQVEPLADLYTSISVYQFAFNNPISYNDPTGLEGVEGEGGASPPGPALPDPYVSPEWWAAAERNPIIGSRIYEDSFGGDFIYSPWAGYTIMGNSSFRTRSHSNYASKSMQLENRMSGRRVGLTFETVGNQSRVTSSSASQQSFNYAAWERKVNASFSNFGRGVEALFGGDGDNMQGFAQGIAGLNPLTSAANVFTGFTEGKNIFGEAQGKGGTALELAGLIPGEGIAAKGTAYLGKGMMAAAPLLVKGIKTGKNLNSNSAIAKFGIYIIEMNGVVHKYGKAHLERITQSSGLPTRLHQQLRKLRKKYPSMDIFGEVIEDLGHMTTKQAKEVETNYIQNFFDKMNFIPFGNSKSFKPKK